MSKQSNRGSSKNCFQIRSVHITIRVKCNYKSNRIRQEARWSYRGRRLRTTKWSTSPLSTTTPATLNLRQRTNKIFLNEAKSLSSSIIEAFKSHKIENVFIGQKILIFFLLNCNNQVNTVYSPNPWLTHEKTKQKTDF